MKNALASPVRNAYYYAALAAKAEGISPEFQKNLGSSPFLYWEINKIDKYNKIIFSIYF